MGVLALVAVGALVLTSCYAPAVRDCTVSCASERDCASGQVCGGDGMCAAPEVAGRCSGFPGDAGPRHDARPPGDPDLDAGLDAAQTVVLHVQIMGKGAVLVDGVGACSSKDPQHGDCMYDVIPGVVLIAHAVEIDRDELFAMWTSPTCAGQGPRCVFTPVAATAIAARFARAP